MRLLCEISELGLALEELDRTTHQEQIGTFLCTLVRRNSEPWGSVRTWDSQHQAAFSTRERRLGARK